MKITRYFVDGYRNLINCEIQLKSGLHGITGCNAVGKSNLFSSLTLLASLLTESESARGRLLNGYNELFEPWTPFHRDEHVPPTFEVEGEVLVNKKVWEFQYKIELSKPLFKEGPYSGLTTPLIINSESLKVKVLGKPGVKRLILSRKVNGNTILTSATKRTKFKFNVLGDLPAISATKVREATDFEDKHPVMASILAGLGGIKTIALSPKILTDFNQNYPIPSRKNSEMESLNRGNTIVVTDIFSNLSKIEIDDFQWEILSVWLSRLLRIEDVSLNTKVVKSEVKGEPDVTRSSLFLRQDSKLLYPTELSSGSIILVAMLSIILAPNLEGEVFLIEEPEAYLHPRAIADFVTLLYDVAEKNTIIISTHSPVVLNSMKLENVTLMAFDSNNETRAIPVIEIKQATEALERGWASFGDLLQTNFELEDA